MMAVFVSRWGERVRVQTRTHRGHNLPVRSGDLNDFSINAEKMNFRGLEKKTKLRFDMY